MSRRAARTVALQMLFQIEVGENALETALGTLRAVTKGAEPPSQAEEPGAAEILSPPLAPVYADFARALLLGVLSRQPELDELIRKYSRQWSFERLANVDKCLLRMGIYELFYCLDTDPAIIINEAVELAKQFGTDDSSAFVNAVLDNIRLKEPLPERTARQTPKEMTEAQN